MFEAMANIRMLLLSIVYTFEAVLTLIYSSRSINGLFFPKCTAKTSTCAAKLPQTKKLFQETKDPEKVSTLAMVDVEYVYVIDNETRL